jgi:hypothetical protein
LQVYKNKGIRKKEEEEGNQNKKDNGSYRRHILDIVLAK